MQTKVKVRVIQFEDLEAKLREAGLQAILIAAAALVRGASRNVPVLTGMARSTWSELAAYVGVNLPVGGNPTPSRNPAAGRSQSDFSFQSSGAVATFKWESDVTHYNILESNTNPRVASAPWNSLEYGVMKAKEAVKADIIPLMASAFKASIKYSERTF
ncbi:MAG: hypothetical protein D4S01_01760 [Dehalococcoidia bacterium]|nr:MAG: hypothetical protein D4S01_01760 [Dehalococcoidia bacterium]